MPIVSRQIEPGIEVIAVSGRLVFGREVELLESAVDGVIRKGKARLVFDLTALDYVDSSGIGAIVKCLTDVKKAGSELRVAGLNPRIRKLFQISGVDQILSVFPTLADAVGA
jgi:anti-sigma B factor antagonist